MDIIRTDDVTAFLVPFSEIEFVRNNTGRLSISLLISIEVDINDVAATFNNITTSKTALDDLFELGTTLMRGIQTVKIIKDQQRRDSNVRFNKPKIEDHKVFISNITITLDKPGKYGLIFGANGVFTNVLTEEIFIEVEHSVSVLKSFFDAGETAILTVFYFLVLLLSSKLVKGYWMFIAILVTAAYVYLVTFKSNASMFYMGTVYFFASIIAIFMIWAFLTFFIDTFIRKKEPSYFFNKKRQYYMEYIYQKLNGHPSNFWVNKQKKLRMKLDGYYNIYPRSQNSGEDQVKLVSVSAEEEAKNRMDKDMTTSFDLFRAQSEHSLLADYMPEPVVQINTLRKKELASLPVDVVPYEDLGIFRKFIRIFTPFEVMYRKIWVNDCFIYPQVLMT